jgi:hypothetical protein
MLNTDGNNSNPAGGPVSPDVLLASVSRQLRTLYVNAYRSYHASRKGTTTAWGARAIPRWDGGADSYGKVHPPIWPRVAQFCLAMGIDPGRLVRTAFDGWLDARRQLQPPTPEVLLSPVTLARAQQPDFEDAALARHRQERVFRVELTLLQRQGYSVADAVHQIVSDQTLGLQPLFRYCVASSLANGAWMTQLRAQALLEYLFNRQGYDQTWNGLVPAELIATANTLLPAPGEMR